MRDLMNNIDSVGAVTAVSGVADNTAIVSAIVDKLGFDSLTFLIATGSLADADATFVVLVEDGDDSGLSDAAAVADAYLLGTEALATFLFSDDGAVRKIGYIGPKRYCRVTITPAANTGIAAIAVIPVLGHPADGGTVNPPA